MRERFASDLLNRLIKCIRSPYEAMCCEDNKIMMCKIVVWKWSESGTEAVRDVNAICTCVRRPKGNLAPGPMVTNRSSNGICGVHGMGES
jgi:hypothetical protein